MTRRSTVTLVLVIAFELWLYNEYAELGAQSTSGCIRCSEPLWDWAL